MKVVRVSDVTLETLGAENAVSSFKEKLEIVKSLNELKVDYVEFPSVYGKKAEEILVKTACALTDKCGCAISCGNTEEEAEGNFALISSAKRGKLVVSVPVSPVRMEYHVAKKPTAVIAFLAQMTEKAKSLCENTEVELLDATRAEPEFLAEAVKTAIACGANEITICDEQGILLPEDFLKLAEDLRSEVPELKSVSLGLKCSDAFSLGVANIIAGIGFGADRVKLSACGFTDLPDFNKTIKSIDEIGSKKGFNASINKTALNRIVDRIRGLVSKKETADDINAGSDEKLPEDLTLPALSKIVKKRGYALDEDELKIVLSEIKRLSDKKEVNLKELDVIVATCVLQVPPTYTLVSFSVHSSNVIAATASVVLKKGEKELSGISFGNGAVDAAFLALEGIVGRHFELDDFELGAVTEGKEAMGQAIVSLRNDGKIYSGRGVSTDIIGASIRAYINALNKIVYEEKSL